MKLTFLERALLPLSPRMTLDRIQARVAVETVMRHYDGASVGRRTAGWRRRSTDANAANTGAISRLRDYARDLERNNPWVPKALRVIGNSTVGWGIVPKPVTGGKMNRKRAIELWKRWADSTDCDADGMLNFAAMQRHAMRVMAKDGEVIIRRRRRRPSDGLAIPMQLQILEGDFIDTFKDGLTGQEGGPIVQGVEYDAIGRRVAYWLYSQHPGATFRFDSKSWQSQRVPAEDIIHLFRVDRPGQVRGVSWLSPVIVRVKDFDEFEDATLLRQKIAACFSAFVTDTDGTSSPLGEVKPQHPLIEQLEPGMIAYTKPGQSVVFSDPPSVSEFDPYSKNIQRGVAAGVGITYELLTGDYSQVNFSSARMARLEFQENLHEWRWDILIPRFCGRVWDWAMEAALISGGVGERVAAEWTPPPMPMLEPDKEGLAYMRNVRAGLMTPSEMLREQGRDPETHWDEYAKDMETLDDLGIILDSDARNTTQAGNPRNPQAGSAKPAEEKQEEEAAA